LTCASQSGCDLGSTIQCYGTPGPCSSHGLEMVCDGCGCDWNDGSCAGTSDACSSFGGNAACLGCGCLWGLPCAGMHEPCASYAGRTECEGQMGCRWSLCEDYTCT
jgi:hypothetical protein